MRRLEELQNIRAELGWIELAGWLHNFGKLSPHFVRRSGYDDEWLKSPDAEMNADPPLTPAQVNHIINTQGRLGTATLRELLEGFRGPANSGLVGLIALCHGEASGAEKRSAGREKEGLPGPDKFREQPKDFPRYGVTSFGYSSCFYHDENELKKIEKVAIDKAKEAASKIERGGLVDWSELETELRKGLADGRLPIVDVRIADMGKMVAGLMKAAVAEDYLLQRATPPDLNKDVLWRIVRVAMDGPTFIARGSRLADVAGRQQILRESIERLVRQFETELCFGNLVYKDEYGPCFLICGSKDWDAQLEDAIARQWHEPLETGRPGASEEAQIALQCSDAFRRGEVGAYAHQLGLLLKKPVPAATPSLESVRAEWNGKNVEICASCALRPVGPSKQGRDRRQCDTCGNWRSGRVKKWLDEPQSTIWLSEVADNNGRLAVISASFGLEPWLEQGAHTQGNGYLESTVFLERPGHPPRNIAPSTARVRRLTETALEFWQDVEEAVQDRLHAPAQKRALLSGTTGDGTPAENHVYDLVHKSSGMRIAAVWHAGQFIVVENLARLPDMRKTVYQSGATYTVYEASGYASLPSEREKVCEFTVSKPVQQKDPYVPYLPLMLSPRTYQFTVPAAVAMEIAEFIAAKFAREMGRVSDRLALQMTVVAADSGTPFRAVIDAARRGQSRPHTVETWRIQDIQTERREPEANTIEERPANRIHIRFDNGVSRSVPAIFEMPTTEARFALDDYFPYFRLSEGGLAHVTELVPGDRVLVEPSTFDFEFLDSASRRFEMFYEQDVDGTVRRRKGRDPIEDRSHRPYPIECIGELREIWRLLDARLATRQMKLLDGRLAEKQTQWQQTRGELDPAFTEAVIANLEPKPGADPHRKAQRTQLAAAARRGLLGDAIEIGLGIEKREQEKKQ
jgi:hypothetical protein